MSTPTLVYDDDCGFCTWWADQFATRTDLEVVGFSELSEDLLARLPEDYEECSHLVTDDEVYSCGASVEQAVLRTEAGPGLQSLAEFLQQFEDYERFRERAYHWGADRRGKLGAIVSKEPPARQSDDRDESDA